MRKPLIAGNWKMYKTLTDARVLARGIRTSCGSLTDRDVVLCPPYTALAAVGEELKGSPIAWAGQNAHWAKEGAFTGEIAVPMLAELGCHYVIVGHSERRQYFAETDATVNKRMHAVIAGGLIPIVCIGETLTEREANNTFHVIEKQIKESLAGLSAASNAVIAYEPVWAIGTGKTASPAQAEEVHSFIRQEYGKLYGSAPAETIRILYGGSVKPDNMNALMQQPNIDGGLVGGASLDVDSFSKIIRYNL